NSVNGSDTEHGDFDVQYKLGNEDGTPFRDFLFEFLSVVGHDDSYSYQNNIVNPSEAYLALNGTINSGGGSQPVPNYNYTVTQLPITAATALDVWNPPGSTNRTSAAVLSALDDQG